MKEQIQTEAGLNLCDGLNFCARQKLPATVPATERQGETESVREETKSERERLKFLNLVFFFSVSMVFFLV